jgi:hypothetical protein
MGVAILILTESYREETWFLKANCRVQEEGHTSGWVQLRWKIRVQGKAWAGYA